EPPPCQGYRPGARVTFFVLRFAEEKRSRASLATAKTAVRAAAKCTFDERYGRASAPFSVSVEPRPPNRRAHASAPASSATHLAHQGALAWGGSRGPWQRPARRRGRFEPCSVSPSCSWAAPGAVTTLSRENPAAARVIRSARVMR